eukprot:362171-Amphidinium_carterae.1
MKNRSWLHIKRDIATSKHFMRSILAFHKIVFVFMGLGDLWLASLQEHEFGRLREANQDMFRRLSRVNFAKEVSVLHVGAEHRHDQPQGFSFFMDGG